MLKTSMSDHEKLRVVTYPFYFINRQSIHKINCIQRIKKILKGEVFLAIALKWFVSCLDIFYCKLSFSLLTLHFV